MNRLLKQNFATISACATRLSLSLLLCVLFSSVLLPQTIADVPPVVGSISPLSKEINSGLFDLVVTGSNFSDGSIPMKPAAVVKWGGISQPTTVNSSMQLTAHIPASLLTSPSKTPGTIPITVVNPMSGNSATSATFTIYPVVTVTLSSSDVPGGSYITGTVTFNMASTTDVVLNLTSSNPSATPLVNSITVPAGATTANFAVATKGVSSTTTISIFAQPVNGLQKTASLALDPLAKPFIHTNADTFVGNNKVNLVWDAVPGADHYSIYIKKHSGESWPGRQIGYFIRTTSYVDQGTSTRSVDNNTPYDYRISAQPVSGSGSVYSDSVNLTPGTAPDAPDNLQATADSAHIYLTWTAPPGTVSGYYVYRGTVTGGEGGTPIANVAGGSNTQCTDSPSTGTTYFYTVKSYNTIDTSALPSNEASDAKVASSLTAPSDLSAKPGNGEVLLTWTAATNATSYNIYRSGSSPVTDSASNLIASAVIGTPIIVNGASYLSYLDVGTRNSVLTPYYYGIKAVKDAYAVPASTTSQSINSPTNSLVTTNLPAIDDAFVQDGQTSQSGSTSPSLLVKHASSGSSTRWAYLKFDVSPGVVTAAKLTLNGKNKGDGGMHTYSAPDTIYGVTYNGWTGGVFDWTGKPALDGGSYGSFTITGTALPCSWDVGGFVQTQQSPPANTSIVSFGLTMEGDPITQQADYFDSRIGTTPPQLAATRKYPDGQVINYNIEDGAVDSNIAWKYDNKQKLFIELQRFGAFYVQAGVDRKDSSLVDKGISILDWGFALQDRTSGDGMDYYGSFENPMDINYSPGDPTHSTGDPFHSTSLFVEGAARAVLLLKQHSGDFMGNYDAWVTLHSTYLHYAANWLVYMYPNPSLTPVAPDSLPASWTFTTEVLTHRFWLLAAALGQVAELTDNSDSVLGITLQTASQIAAVAAKYAQYGLARQKGNGLPTMLQNMASNPGSGNWYSRTNVSMDTYYPLSSSNTDGNTYINANGVNPETGDDGNIGFDVSYQGVGMNYAARYARLEALNNANKTPLDATYPSSSPSHSILYFIRKMLDAGLAWETDPAMYHMNPLGVNNLAYDAVKNPNGPVVVPTGSTRIGHEDNQGSSMPKQPDLGQLDLAFTTANFIDPADIAPNPQYQVWSQRIENNDDNDNPSSIGSIMSGGAVHYGSGNGTTNATNNYDISKQGAAADYIEDGVHRENPDLIHTGLSALDWAFGSLVQDPTYGSWKKGVGGPDFWTSMQFIEAGARAVSDMESYNPQTSYGMSDAFLPTYSATMTTYTKNLRKGAQYMLQNSVSGDDSATNAQHSLGAAAAFLEVASLPYPNPVDAADAQLTVNLKAKGEAYLASALAMQWSNGVYTKDNKVFLNGTDQSYNQAISIVYAERCRSAEDSQTVKDALLDSVTRSLSWEQQWVLGNGKIFASAPAGNIITAFDLYDPIFNPAVLPFDFITARLDDPGKI